MATQPTVPPGWYPDLYRADLQRYWDGFRWTEHTAPVTVYPEMQRKQKGWGLGDVAIGFGAFFGISVVVTMFVVVLTAASTGGAALTVEDVSSVGILIAGGLGSAAAFLGVPLYATYKKGQRSLAKDFGLRFTWWDPLLAVGMAAGGLLFSALVSFVAMSLFGETPTNTGGLPTGFSGPKIVIVALTLFIVAGVIPFVEEVFFRGLLLRSIQNRASTILAVIGSSVVFGMVHVGGATSLSGLIIIPLVTGMYGLIFALVTVKTKRIGAAIIAHSIINFAAVVVVFSST